MSKFYTVVTPRVTRLAYFGSRTSFYIATIFVYRPQENEYIHHISLYSQKIDKIIEIRNSMITNKFASTILVT